MSTNRPYDDDDLRDSYSGRRAESDPADREISLGMPTILGIFFALALALAAVFGLGYTLGRRSAQTAVYADPAPGSSPGSAAKPSAGTAGQPSYPASQPAAQTPAPLNPPQTATVPLAPVSAPAPSNAAPAADRPSAPAPPPTTSNQQPAATYIVQVAAVSSQDVADILISSLQKKGYTVAVRHEPQDKLLHVQIGPFADKKEAEAMRARVLADGFNAIVK
jgi:DedD protein